MKSLFFRIVPFFFITLVLLSGCVNKRGLSTSYYDNCKESYDAVGVYSKECPENYLSWSKERITPQCLGCK
jgi:hypothetical protein